MRGDVLGWRSSLPRYETLTSAVAREKGKISILEECFGVDSSLPENGAERALGHIAWMVGDGRVAMRDGIDPDLVRAGSLAAKFKTHTLQSSHDLQVSKTGEPAYQVLTINGYSNESWAGGKRRSLASPSCIPINFFATSRAISMASCMVRPWATRPFTSSEVAR
jgi:hypothetical protein